jgi:MFS family permease
MKLPKALSALHHRDFRVYWAGQAVSLTGTWMQHMAQSWVLAGLSRSARDMGLAALISSAPILLLSFKAGSLADRVDKRRILLTTQVCLMLLAFVFAALLVAGRLSVGLVLGMAGLLGVVAAFDLPAAQALPSELVTPSEIGSAAALMQQVLHGARLLGPAIAGVLITRLGNVSAFIANGVSFLFVIVSLAVIQPRDKRAGAAKKPAKGGSREAFAHVREDPVLRALILLVALSTSAALPFLAALMAHYVRHVMRAEDAAVMGTLMSASGLGSLLGATAIVWSSAAARRYWMTFGVVGVSGALFCLSLSPSPTVAALLVGLQSFAISSVMGRASQTVQERAPAELRGRIMGIYGMAFSGVMPLASLALSVLSDRVGYSLVMRAAAVVYLALGLLLLSIVWRALAAVGSTGEMP